MMKFRPILTLCFAIVALAGCANNSQSQTQPADSVLCVDSIVESPRKVSILGDSYSTFEGYMTPDDNISWYKTVPKEGRPTDVTDVNQTWWKIFIDENGYELDTNNSYSGSTICNTGYGKQDYSDRSFATRLTNIGHPDLIIIFGGTNDAWANSPIGEYVWSDWTPKQLYSFRPATAYTLSQLEELHPDAEKVFLINDGLKPEITSSIVEICQHYGVSPVLLEDIHKMSDHPDQEGMRQIASQLQQALEK